MFSGLSEPLLDPPEGEPTCGLSAVGPCTVPEISGPWKLKKNSIMVATPKASSDDMPVPITLDALLTVGVPKSSSEFITVGWTVFLPRDGVPRASEEAIPVTAAASGRVAE